MKKMNTMKELKDTELDMVAGGVLDSVGDLLNTTVGSVTGLVGSTVGSVSGIVGSAVSSIGSSIIVRRPG